MTCVPSLESALLLGGEYLHHDNDFIPCWVRWWVDGWMSCRMRSSGYTQTHLRGTLAVDGRLHTTAGLKSLTAALGAHAADAGLLPAYEFA
jgi:hypothetical protein